MRPTLGLPFALTFALTFARGCALALILALGCAPNVLHVGSTRDDTGRFDAYRTFSLGEEPGGSTPGAEHRAPSDVRAVIRRELAKGLQQHGLREVADGQADVALRFSVGETDAIQVVGHLDHGLRAVPFVEGHLSVGVFDLKDGRMVWHAWAQLRLYREEEDTRLAREVAQKIVARYPNSGGPR